MQSHSTSLNNTLQLQVSADGPKRVR
eukprot:COSAG05_NODE_23891_length_255_cov_0.653846_1_plen_25_part_10